MKKKNLLLIIVQFIIWYFFVYFWLYTIKNEVNLWLNSLILIIIAGVGVIIFLIYKK